MRETSLIELSAPQATLAVGAITVLAAVATLLLKGAGTVAWRWATGGALQDKARLYASMTETIGKMKAAGVSQQDLERFKAYLKGKAAPLEVLASKAGDTEQGAESLAPWLHPEYYERGMEPYEPETQVAMNMVAEAKVLDVEARMRHVLWELERQIDEEDKELLNTAQQAWEIYRDHQAKFSSQPFSGGSIRTLIEFSERRTLTVRRLAEVQADLDQRNIHAEDSTV